MNDLTTAAVERLTAQLGEALFGEPGLSLMEIANRRAEIEQMAKDAGRHAWLKSEASRNNRGDPPGRLLVIVSQNQTRADGEGFTGMGITPTGDGFDFAIDAAMAAMKEQAE